MFVKDLGKLRMEKWPYCKVGSIVSVRRIVEKDDECDEGVILDQDSIDDKNPWSIDFFEKYYTNTKLNSGGNV